MDITIPELQQQWNSFSQSPLCNMLIQEATRVGLPPAFACAIASRETNMVNMIGDGGHGVGLIQIDIRFHPIAVYAKESGEWSCNPRPLIAYGCALLATDYHALQRAYPDLTMLQCLKGTADAYNAGLGGAESGHTDGDFDENSTGGDYGSDVMDRHSILEGIVALHIQHQPQAIVVPPTSHYPGFGQ